MISAPSTFRSDTALDELIEIICANVQSGSNPKLDDLIKAYPEHADGIRKLYPTLLALAAFAFSDSNVVSPATEEERDDHSLVRGGRLLGDFRIERQIGRGGMGIVYEARQISIDRRVALKVLPLVSLIDQRTVQRFQNEVRAAALLEHPNIVAVYSVGEDQGVHYYAMQLIRGQSLANVIAALREHVARTGLVDGSSISRVLAESTSRASGSTPGAEEKGSGLFCAKHPEGHPGKRDLTPFPRSGAANKRLLTPVNDRRSRFDAEFFRNVAQLGIQAANALDEAHQHGVVHRDIKPGNLLLDQHGTLFVADFGLARIETDAGITVTGDLMGTLRYMSPEQVGGDQYDIGPRTDIYSLGATLYELIALRPMFCETDRGALVRKITFEEPDALRSLNPAVPTDLEVIIAKATRKNSVERYGRGRDLAEDLQRFLDHRPIVAKMPTLLNRLSKWGRRNSSLVVLSAIGLVLATIGLVISNVLILRQKNIAVQKTIDAWNSKKLSDELAAKEKLARETSEELNKQTSEYNEILRGIFKDLDLRKKPADGPAIANLLADRLVQAGELIGKSDYQMFQYQVELLTDLGATLINLGYPDRATDVYRRAEEIVQTNSTKAESSWIAFTSNHNGRSFLSLGQFESAAAAYQRAYDYYQRTEPDSLNALSSLHGLAVAQLESGKYRDCIANLEIVVPKRIALHGESHRATLTSMSVLATAYQRNDQLDKSRDWMDRVYRLRQRAFGDDAVDTNTTRSNLAMLLQQMGDESAACDLLEQAAAAMKKTLGEDHPDFNVVQVNLALAKCNLGDCDEALAIVEPALKRLTDRLGPEHVRTLRGLSAKGAILVDLNRVAEAVPILQECLDLSRKIEGDSTPATLRIALSLADALTLAGQLEDGHRLAASTLELAIEQLGASHDTTMLARLSCARAMTLAADPTGAVAELKKAIELIGSGETAQTKSRLLLDAELAFALLVNGNYEESRQILNGILDVWTDRLGPNHPVLKSAQRDLALVAAKLADWPAAREAIEQIEPQLTDAQHSGLARQVELMKSLIQISAGDPDVSSREIIAACETILSDIGSVNRFDRIFLRQLLVSLDQAAAAHEGTAEVESARRAISNLLGSLN